MSKSLKVGNVVIGGRAWIAPMTGVSDLPFRRAASRLGAAYVATEMVACAEFSRGRPDVVRRAAVGEGLPLMVVQLVGREPEHMAEGARLAARAGAQLIDLNFGCPAKEVTGALCGSALMRDPDLAQSLIEAAVRAVDIPVTVKMRLGWDAASANAPEIAARAQACGAAAVTVHGRTRCQFYKGEADWGAVRAVKDAITVPLVVNGDITSFEKAVSALEMSDADAVMIGRGAQGQPWLLGQIGRQLETGKPEAAPSLAEQLAHIRALYDEVCRLYGLRIGLKHARKHLGWALEIAAECSRAPAETLKGWRQKILTSEDPHRVHRSLQDAYDDFAWSAAA